MKFQIELFTQIVNLIRENVCGLYIIECRENQDVVTSSYHKQFTKRETTVCMSNHV